MSTPDVTQPPAAPPTTPPLPPTAQQPPGGGDPVGSARVTRNVAPKRVMVLPGNTVTYGGQSYGPGDSFLLGEGPVADGFVLQGYVEIVDHNQADEWNGKEGDEVRKAAHAHLDALAAADPNVDGDKRTHDHGFVKYTHADGADAEPTDHTTFRQQAAAEQRMRGTTMAEHQRGKEGK